MRAIEIVRELEKEPRGIYCGAIGSFSPDGSANFNVAIRTLTIEAAEGRLGIGGGIVVDSKLDDEYECPIKARFVEGGRPPSSLIETLRFDPVEGIVGPICTSRAWRAPLRYLASHSTKTPLWKRFITP